jgi:RNA polymerase sigma factor (sigma-70 family)
VIEKVEIDVREAHERGDVHAMTATLIEGYGGEIYGFLVTAHGNFSDADDVFSSFGVALWRSLERFDMRCAGRTWAYRVARAASADHFRAATRRRESPLHPSAELSALVVRVRTATASHLKTERKTELQRLREELDPDDRALLVLRVDRRLAWKDLALVFLTERSVDDASPPDEGSLAREAARLRQRFQTIKRRLREMGRERGLIQ